MAKNGQSLAALNLPNFWYGTSLNFDSFRGTNHTVSCLFIVIIFTAFRLAASFFIYFLFIWPPSRDPSIARLLIKKNEFKILTSKFLTRFGPFLVKVIIFAPK